MGEVFHALTHASRLAVFASQLSVFAMKDRFPTSLGSCSGRIDQRAEVVAVNHVRLDAPDQFDQPEQRANGESVRLLEGVDLLGFGEPAGEGAFPLEAADMSVKFIWIEMLGEVGEAVFHAAWIQRKNDMQDS